MLKNKKKSKFLKDLSISTYSSIISFLISIGLSPIMTRLYEPNEYGIFSVINTIGIFIATFAMLSIQSAFSIEKSYLKKVQLLGLLTNIAMLTFFIVFVFILFLFLFIPNLYYYYFLLPILVFAIIMQRTYFSLSVSHEKFSDIAKARIAHPFIAKISSIIAVLIFQSNASFLILFESLGYFLQTYILFKNEETKNIKKYISRVFNFKSHFKIMKRYKSFISYYHLSNLIFIIFTMLQVLTISINYSEYETGVFSLATSMSNLPIQLISLTLASVLYQKMITIYTNNQNLFNFVIKVILGFSFLGLIPYGMIYFFGIEIFSLLFGSKWLDSGIVAEIICMNLYMYFIFMPIDSIFRIVKKLHIKFLFDLLSLSTIIFLFYIFSKNNEFIDSIKILSYSLFIYYFILIVIVIYILRIIKNENIN